MNKILPYLEKILETTPLLLALVLPLFFLPITTEFYETAKVGLLLLASSLLFVVWALKTLTEKKLAFLHSPLDLPVLILVASLTAAAIFSPNHYLALFGSYLRFQPSLVFSLALIVSYYVFSTNLKTTAVREKVIFGFVLSVSLSSLLGILSYLGVFELIPGLPLFIKSRAFNTVGSLSGLSVLAAAALPLALGLGSRKDPGSDGLRSGILALAPYLLVALVVLLKTPAGLVLLPASLVFYLLLKPKESLVRLSRKLLPLFALAVILSLATRAPVVSKIFNPNSAPREVTLGVSQSWQIATQALSARPIFGGGIGSYPNLFTLFKPLTYNTGESWNLRFDRPTADALLWLSEAGLVGLLAFLFLFFKVGSLILASKDPGSLAVRSGILTPDNFTSSLSATVLTLSLSFFLTSNTSLAYFFLFFFLALLSGELSEKGHKMFERVGLTLAALKEKLELRSKKSEVSQIAGTIDSRVLPGVMVVVSALALVGAIYTVTLVYGADFYNRRSLEAVSRNDGRAAYENALLTTRLNPYLDVYQRNLSQIALGVAVNLASRPQLSDQERQTVRDLIQESINRIRLVSEVINPAGVANWEVRAQVYSSLIGVAQNAEVWTVDAYSRAVGLDPLNPNLRLLLGGVYFGQNLFEQAQLAFSQAISLKPDLANAHYNLAQALVKLNRKAEALTQYDITLNLVGLASPDYERAKKEREDLAKEIREEALKAAPSSTTAGPQEPLKVSAPGSTIQKENVAPPPLDLGTPGKEASPAAAN